MDEEPAANLMESPAGTWHDPDLSANQCAILLATAAKFVPTLEGKVGVLFSQAIAIAQAKLDAAMANMTDEIKEDTSRYLPWHSHDFNAVPHTIAAFVEHCDSMITRDKLAGVEYKVTHRHQMTTAGVFIEHIGSIVVHQWHNVDTENLAYFPFRDSFFMESLRDSAPRIAEPIQTWGHAYCADKIAYSHKGIASVPTFAYRGREYINDGMSHHGDYSECEGWTFRPFADWHGPTYSYAEQCRAWDDGRLERGDRRGLVVHVRGQRCVLDGCAVFFDEHTQPLDYCTHDDEGEQGDNDPDADIDRDENELSE